MPVGNLEYKPFHPEVSTGNFNFPQAPTKVSTWGAGILPAMLRGTAQAPALHLALSRDYCGSVTILAARHQCARFDPAIRSHSKIDSDFVGAALAARCSRAATKSDTGA